MFGKKNDTNWQAKYNDKAALCKELETKHEQTVKVNKSLREELYTKTQTLAEQSKDHEGLLAWIHTACQTVASLPSNRKIKALETLRDEAQTRGWLSE
jgi:hypothetical protein